jgi:hypothetical protein
MHESQSTTYEVEVGLTDGSTLKDEVAGGTRTLVTFRRLHQRLASESVVAFSERLVVRSEEVRFIRIRIR